MLVTTVDYYITTNNIWNVFLKYPEMLLFFEVNVIELAEKKLDLETEDRKCCIRSPVKRN